MCSKIVLVERNECKRRDGRQRRTTDRDEKELIRERRIGGANENND